MNFIISLRVSYVSHSSVGEAIETDLLDRKSVDTLLVGGFNHLEKYEFVNGKDDNPYMKWKITQSCSKPPTSILIIDYHY